MHTHLIIINLNIAIQNTRLRSRGFGVIEMESIILFMAESIILFFDWVGVYLVESESIISKHPESESIL